MRSAALPWTLLAALAVAWFASSVMGGESGDEARADERAADSLAAVRDSVVRESAAQAQAYADSSRAWAERMRDAEAREAAAVALGRRATLRAAAVATDLTARLDSTEAAMFAEYSMARDSSEAALGQVIVAVQDQLATVTADRDALLVRLSSVSDAFALAMQENTALRAANEALRDRIRGLERQGTLTKTALAVGVVAVAVDKVAS